MNISESLKRFRKDFSLSQEDVANAIGTSKQVYYRYEKNVMPSAETIKKISVAFSASTGCYISTDYLLGLTDKPNNNPSAEIINAIENCYKIVKNIN